ncbi:MAG: glucose-6-phosphate isomerase/transaldolase / glucose-6-phosphate isomerase [Chloroflexi bacterium]|jgi:glucose-6-phosphate isomerase/transaldolase/glucose-6-phosphate isomerase|nr:MAG: glucose-6-phosphate isomerase/transaldolase / glucose-6-phosphate isomerase [Chloroflexota bacterium]
MTSTESLQGLPGVEATLADLQARDIVARIWQRDHTVWKPEPTEIANRLGWLTVTAQMRQDLPSLTALADAVRSEGYKHVVLLGMGGSSLGPEVLRQTFGSAPGYPELLVLDSTVPAWIQAVGNSIDPARTLFLVSSKSGGTIEPLSLYRHFRGLVNAAVGESKAGAHFVAVTDPGTPLETLAEEQGFRRAFANPADIGGRYSVLSYFGLVPAALIGVDVAELLDRADGMRDSCAAGVSVENNPGAYLGAVMGTAALAGKDKLTLITSPSIGSFGLWVEQLIAESTGKEGTGIVPIAGEPVLSPEFYGDDRLFAYLRVQNDDNADLDAQVDALESAGHPTVRLNLADTYDLGAEFFRWEFATAIASAVMGIHPFDQPNVQQAKNLTDQVLGEYQATGALPSAETSKSVEDLLGDAQGSDGYLAIMAYVRPTPETERALTALRRKILERKHLPTTMGYGPRFLHSTGQLHKGGPASGYYLQITVDRQEDIAVPGAPYTFGTLADAQAIGDLQALEATGRRAAAVRLAEVTEAAIAAVGDALVGK